MIENVHTEITDNIPMTDSSNGFPLETVAFVAEQKVKSVIFSRMFAETISEEMGSDTEQVEDEPRAPGTTPAAVASTSASRIASFVHVVEKPTGSQCRKSWRC